ASREMLLRSVGVRVISALGPVQAQLKCRLQADLLVLGHSVPTDEKRHIIACFRRYSTAPVLSLLRPHQEKLAEADFGIETSDPAAVVGLVYEILHNKAN